VQTQAVSPDGKWIAFGDASGTVMVLPNPGPMMDWDAEPALQWKSDRPISELRFVDESTIVLTADEHLYVWTLSTEQPSQPSQMHGHSARIQGMDVSGNLLVTGDVSGQIIAWNISERSRLAEMKANTSIRDVALIPGTRDFIFAGARGGQSADVLAYRIPESGNTAMVRLGQLRMTREQNFPPTRVSVSPDGALLVISNSNNGQLFVLPRVGTTDDDRLPGFPFQHPADFTTDQNDQWLVSQHTRPVNDLQWSVDGRHLLTASDDRRIGVWSRSVDRTDGDTNVRSTLKLLQHLQGHGGRVTQAVFLNAAATRISSTSADGYCRLWDLESLDEDSRRIREAFGLTSANRQSRHNIMGAIYLCAAGSEENAAHISPRRSATQAVESNAVEPAESVVLNSNANPHRGTVRSVAFSSDGRQLVSGASDGSIIVWDTQTHQSISGPESVPPTAVSEQFKEGHQFNIARMRLLGADRTILATAGFDGSLRFWNMNMASGREGVQQQVIGGLGLLNTFAASADGKLLVTTSVRHQSVPANHHTCLWNLQSLMTATHPVPVATLQGTHRGEVTAISVSPDSRFIATGGRDGVVAIWDVKDSQRITSLAAHAKNTIVTSLEWLKDGSLLSAGLDGKLTQWSFAPAVNALASAAVRTENANDSGPAEKPTTQPVFRLTPQTRFTRGRTPIEHIAVSPDQTRMLTVSVVTDRTSKKTTCLLDHWWLNSPATPERINLAAVAGKSPETISSAQWSADGRQVLVCAADCVQVLDSDSWKVVRVFSAGGSGVTDAQFVNPVSGMMPTSEIADAGSKRELVITFDSTDATLWDLADGSPLVSFTGPSPVREVAVLEGTMGRFVLSVGQSLQVFDGGSQNEQFGRPLFHLPQDRSQIAAIAACPVEADLLLTGDEGGQVVLWKWLADQQKLNHEGVIASLTHRVVDVNWSTDGQHIVAVTADGRVHVFRRDGTQPMVIRPAGDVAVELASAQFAPAGQHPREQHLVVTGRIAATLESAGWVLRWREIAAREVAAREVAADNDRETSETGEQNGANSGARATVVCRFSGHEAGGISSASFVPGSPYLVSGGSDGSLILWNWQNPIPAEIPSAYEAYRFLAADQTTAHQGPVSAVAVSRTNAIASCSQDGQIVLWNLPLLQSNTPGNK
jgi:WD40 repeat protein